MQGRPVEAGACFAAGKQIAQEEREAAESAGQVEVVAVLVRKMTEEYEDMLQAGIVDPAKVVRAAL
ncbi:MAG: hypothetical protein ACJ8C3_07960, partial [Microvirga sp.]